MCTSFMRGNLVAFHNNHICDQHTPAAERTTKIFSKYFHLKIWNPHNDFQKRKIRLVGNTIDQPIPKHKLLISIPAKKFNYIQKKRFILFVIYIQIHYMFENPYCDWWTEFAFGLAHPYLYSFIHSSTIHTFNSNSALVIVVIVQQFRCKTPFWTALQF